MLKVTVSKFRNLPNFNNHLNITSEYRTTIIFHCSIFSIFTLLIYHLILIVLELIISVITFLLEVLTINRKAFVRSDFSY